MNLISKPRVNGGLGLINIIKHIQSTKIKMYNNLDKNRLETDDLLYHIGRRTEIMINKSCKGPKPEIYNLKYEPEIKLILQNKDILKLETMKAKEIENIVHAPNNNIPHKEIW